MIVLHEEKKDNTECSTVLNKNLIGNEKTVRNGIKGFRLLASGVFQP